MEIYIELVFEDAPKVIQLYKNERHFFLDGEKHIFSTDRSTTLLFAIAMCHPHTSSYNYIIKELEKNNFCITGDKVDAVHRIVNKIVADFKKLPIPSVLSNIRGYGYELKNGWRVNISPTHQHDIISIWMNDLTNLVARCIEYSQTKKVVIQDNHKMLIEADSFFVKENIILMNSLHIRLKGIYLQNKAIYELLSFDDIFKLLESYISFQRIGSNITSDEWKKAYEIEITHLRNKLFMLIKFVGESPSILK